MEKCEKGNWRKASTNVMPSRNKEEGYCGWCVLCIVVE